MISDEKILENKNEIIALLQQVERNGKDKLIDWLNSKECDFFIAPASSMHHLHVIGGLAQHSLNVYHTLQNLNELFNQNISEETMIVSALLHDFCKINLYKNNILKSGSISASKPFVTEDLFPSGHGEKSVMIAMNLIDLTEQEILMIRWHMGLYDRAFIQSANQVWKICPAAYLLFQADWMASLYVDDEEVTQ